MKTTPPRRTIAALTLAAILTTGVSLPAVADDAPLEEQTPAPTEQETPLRDSAQEDAQESQPLAPTNETAAPPAVTPGADLDLARTEPLNIDLSEQAFAAAQALRPGSGGTRHFDDVPKGHKFYKPIMWMYGSGLTTGTKTPYGISYLPSDGLSREAMAAFLYRQAGSPAFTSKRSFSDIPTTHKFYKPIMWMRATGLTTGYADGGFHPKEGLSREAMAAFLYRQAGKPKATSGTPRFLDVPSSHKFSKEIQWMRAAGVTTGYADGGYHPKEGVSREAMAAFLHRQAGSPAFIESGSVNIAGKAAVDQTLKASVKGWSPSKISYTYQWLRNGAAIAGATSSSYKVIAADQGKELQVSVTGTLPGVQNVKLISAGTARVAAKPLSLAQWREGTRQAIFKNVNLQRTKYGLNALVWDMRYEQGANVDAATQLSRLDAGNNLVHLNRYSFWPQYGITEYEEMPYDVVVGGMAQSPDALGKQMVETWMGSPGHCWWLLRESATSMYPGTAVMGYELDPSYMLGTSTLAIRIDESWFTKPGYSSSDPKWPAVQVCK